MALNAYLQLEGIPAEDGPAKDAIELLSFSWGVSNAGALSQQGSGRGGSKAELQSFNFVHKVDKASPVLFKKDCSGELILIGLLQVEQGAGLPSPAGQVSFNDATTIGRGGLVFMKVRLEDILISSVKEFGKAQDDA